SDERENSYDLGQAQVRSHRPLFRGHVLPVHPVGETDVRSRRGPRLRHGGASGFHAARAFEDLDARVRLSRERMTDSAPTPSALAPPWSADELVERLRAQGSRYHNLHPFHVRMDAGELTREELRRWVANRFYYQVCIPLKDAAIMSNCREVEVRREWISRII